MAASELSATLLVAMPQLDDPNFHRGVVLLVHHEAEGSFGLVLNRPVDLTPTQILENVGVTWRGDDSTAVSWGGPVEPSMGWVVFCGEPPVKTSDGEVTTLREGVRVTGSLEVLRAMAAAPPPDLRLFLGYAGWGAGQLESELAEGAWLMAPLTRAVVFETAADAMWERVVRGLGVEPSALVPTRGIH